MRGRGKGGEGPVIEVREREVRFDCAMLPCIHFEIKWANPLPPPTVANIRAVDANGQPVPLNQAEIQQVTQAITNPGAVPVLPPAAATVMPCISPCECLDQQVQAWVQWQQPVTVDVTLDVEFPGSAATKAIVSVTWMADRFRFTVGRCGSVT
jgi:hypothetical protein